MRGRDTWDTRPCSSIGITPAYAGKRHVCNAPCKGMGDHPRVCGEEARSVGRGVAHRGSPPRVRGKGCVIHFSCPPYGITPACAGKSHIPNTCVTTTWDHPRVCGEKAIVKSPSDKLKGSPPRVRGKGLLQMAGRSEPGITPACAGKSFRSNAVGTLDRDHPRVCGEKGNGCFAVISCRGSPPRVRGKVFYYPRQSRKKRITPACAGKSLRTRCADLTAGDHPRVCGEKYFTIRDKVAKKGSPPRVRGKAGYLAIKRMDEGITPAYAGKSSTATRAARSTGDHPRICGEKQKSSGAGLRKWGSPPRMRGKAPLSVLPVFRSGITPACAGKSSPSSCCNHLD